MRGTEDCMFLRAVEQDGQASRPDNPSVPRHVTKLHICLTPSACAAQITTYKVHKVEHCDSSQSSMDERVLRVMSSLSLTARNSGNPLGDSGCVETPKAHVFADSAGRGNAFADPAEAPRRSSGSSMELTLDFTETGCVLREGPSPSPEVHPSAALHCPALTCT